MNMKLDSVIARSILLLKLIIVASLCSGQQPASTNSEHRLRRFEWSAYQEAMQEQRTDLIPVLEELAGKPGSGDPPRIALAKLGVKKYLDEIVEELISPTNTARYAYYRRVGSGSTNPAWAEAKTIEQACDKLENPRQEHRQIPHCDVGL
jgi:hypothetical protein